MILIFPPKAGTLKPASTWHTMFVHPPPTMTEARRFCPQQRIVHITTPSNCSRDPTSESVSPPNGPSKTVQSISTRHLLFALSSSEGFSERQLRTTIAKTIRRLRITFLNRFLRKLPVTCVIRLLRLNAILTRVASVIFKPMLIVIRDPLHTAFCSV